MRRRELLMGIALVSTSSPGQTMPALQAFTENLPPLNFSAASGPAGFSVELLRLMAGAAELTLDIEVQPWIRAVRSAAEAKNPVLFSLARLPEREALLSIKLRLLAGLVRLRSDGRYAALRRRYFD